MKFPNEKYSVIYCDPPWDYKGQATFLGKKKDNSSALQHYPTMPLKELKVLRVPDIAENDCALFMWATSPHLDQAIELGVAWGFQYRTVAFVWDKARVNVGYWTMSSYEICLVFCKGKIPQPRGSRNERQGIYEKATEHSTKPNEVRKRIGRMFPNHKKIELFARNTAEGWDSWGNDKSLDEQGGLL